MTYYEDPRRFSSRVIGFSFQGPRGRTFLPSGSRCLVSLVFVVKDFVRLSFHRGFRCGLFSLRFRRASRVRSGSRYLVSAVFAVKDFVKLSSATSCFALCRARPFRAGLRWGPKREAVYAPAYPLPASTFVTICRFPKNSAVSWASDPKRLYFCAVIGRSEGS